MSVDARMGWIEREGVLALARQCELAGVARATWYARQAPAMESEEDLLLCRLIDEEYTRRGLAWRISNSMDTSFCIDCLEDALSSHGKPAVFNSDQGSQFTSAAFAGVLEREGIAISMDGRGCALDNIFVERLWRSVKHEDVYLKGYGTVAEPTVGLAEYFAFYNGDRPHQSLGNRTPNAVYANGSGGGASIPDYFGGARGESPAPLRCAGNSPRATTTGQCCSAAIEAMDAA